MPDLDQQIEQEKQRYLDFAALNKGKKIYIYGAGKQAAPVADFYREKGVTVAGFCVTDQSANQKVLRNLPVCQVDEIPYEDKDTAFVCGVRVQLNEEIKEILNRNGYTNFLPASDLIRYLGSYGYSFYTKPMMEITTRLGCSVNCRYCPQELFLREYMKAGNSEKVLTCENFKICLDRLPADTLIEFAGFTEPFLNEQCMDMIAYAKQRGHKVNIFTTLVGLKPTQLDALLKMEFEEFVLHVPDKEGYAVIPMDESYMEMVERLAGAKKPDGSGFIDYACAQGTVPEEITGLLGDNTRIYVVLNDRAGNLKDSCLYGKRGLGGRIRCELSKDINHNVLLPDGRVVLCSNDWGMKHVMGNLLHDTYEEILNGEEAAGIREAMERENGRFVLCRNCFQALQAD